MYTLKPLSRDGIPGAMRKAERYRLLGEAWEAESICRDVLEVEPENQDAQVMLLLAITDQFGRQLGGSLEAARAILPKLEGDYRRAYYEGIICERWAKAQLDGPPSPGNGSQIYDSLKRAMDCYQRAEGLRPAGEDDPLLRWNTCVRLLGKHPDLRPSTPEERAEHPLE